MIQTYLILGEVFFAVSNTHSPERKEKLKNIISYTSIE